jgi:large subunit ribosomal protein L24
MVSTLEKVLRKKYGMRNVEIRKGDEVKIMRGKFSKKVGKVVEVNRKKGKVSLEGINNSKKDGTKVRVWFFPSKLKIIQMNEEDKRRFDLTKRTGKENA